jgi:hypothetical protein
MLSHAVFSPVKKLPYMSQGAAQAIEDAAVLAKCLKGLTAADDIHASLKLYEAIRKPRAVEVQNRSSLNGRIWHCESFIENVKAKYHSVFIYSPSLPINQIRMVLIKRHAIEACKLLSLIHSTCGLPISGLTLLYNYGFMLTTQKLMLKKYFKVQKLHQELQNMEYRSKEKEGKMAPRIAALKRCFTVVFWRDQWLTDL